MPDSLAIDTLLPLHDLPAAAADSIVPLPAPEHPAVADSSSLSLLNNLPTGTVDTVVTLPLFYRQTAADDALLSRDTLLFASTAHPAGQPWGVEGREMPDTAHRSETISVGLLLCFLLLCFLRLSYRGSVRTAISDFFISSNVKDSVAISTNQEWRRIIVALFFSLQGALTTMMVAQAYGCTPLINAHWAYVGIFGAAFFLLVLVRQGLSHFVHSIFLTHEYQRRWRNTYAFIFTAESILIYPFLLLFVYLQIDLKITALGILLLLLFVKILLLFRCFSAFFGKKHGSLLLFVYFCTLEAAPLLVLWTVLTEIIQELYLI